MCMREWSIKHYLSRLKQCVLTDSSPGTCCLQAPAAHRTTQQIQLTLENWKVIGLENCLPSERRTE